MGLLDDAIREHLELKRLRGADPGQVARDEHEALGPVDRGAGHQAQDPAVDVSEQAPAGRDGAPSQASTEAGEETTELDMSKVLEEHTTPHVPGSESQQVESGPVVPASTGESLEWEMPHEQPGESSGEELHESDDPPQEPVEDVLEETPEFLRETPEQERLWFEQRPPRDFDFDK